MSDLIIAAIIWWCLPGLWVWIGGWLLRLHAGVNWSFERGYTMNDLFLDVSTLVLYPLTVPIVILYNDDVTDSILWMAGICYDD